MAEPEQRPAEATLVWEQDERRWRPVEPPRPEALLAADSWLLSNGEVRGWDLHRDRFAGSCAEAGAEAAVVGALLEAVPAALPGVAEWFPRVELREGGGFVLRLRPRPAAREGAAVWLASEDPREAPRTKGPDIERLAELRERAAEHGADEALLPNERGEPIEGAASNLVWWVGDELRRVPAEEAKLPGVTERLLLAIAEETGVTVGEEPMQPAEAGAHETWLLNSLVGILPVTRWVGDGDAAIEAPRGDAALLAEWRGRLEALARPWAEA